MATDACQFFYDCKGCGVRLKPKQGDCCVFCSFGTVPCPPMQTGGKGRPLLGAREVLANLKQWARLLKRDVHAVYLASRDPRVPWYAKAIGIAVAAYALSPVDLIPDFIPILGYLDDLIIVPLGIALVIRLIPPEVMEHHRELAAAAQERPISRVAVAAIAVIWILAAMLFAWLVYRLVY